MVKAYVLASVEPGHVKSVLMQIKELRDVIEASAVTGPYDIIAKVKGKDIEEIGRSVVTKIQTLEGVERTLTAIVVNIE